MFIPPDYVYYFTDLQKFFNAYASQKTTYIGTADLAIDGDKNPFHSGGSCVHTYTYSPWWMVDLFVNFHVESVIIWHRLDCCCK